MDLAQSVLTGVVTLVLSLFMGNFLRQANIEASKDHQEVFEQDEQP